MSFKSYRYLFLVAVVLLVPLLTRAQCTSGQAGQNLVINSDFNDGYNDFTIPPAYTIFKSDPALYDSCNGRVWPDWRSWSQPGEVLVGDDPRVFNSVFLGSGLTGAGDNFYMIDGAYQVEEFWCQSVTVNGGEYYYFQMSAMTLFTDFSGTDLAEFEFYLDGVPFGNQFTTPAVPGTWETYIDSIFIPAGGTFDLCIVNTNPANVCGGNDWAIDGLIFAEGCQFGSSGPQPDLGPDQSLCGSGGSITLEDPALTSTPGIVYEWSTGATTSSITVSAAGTYYLCAYQPGSCVKSDSIVITDQFSIDLGSDLILCDPVSATLDAGYNVPGTSYQWYFDGGGGFNAISGEVSQTYTATNPGDYRVVVTVAGCGSEQDDINISSTAGITANNQTFCTVPSNVTLSVAGGGEYGWYANSTGGSTIGSGLTFDFVGLTSDTTVWVEDTASSEITVGTGGWPCDPNPGPITDPTTYFVRFDVYEPISIDTLSVMVHNSAVAGGATNVRFRVHSAKNYYGDFVAIGDWATLAATPTNGTELRVPSGMIIDPPASPTTYYLSVEVTGYTNQIQSAQCVNAHLDFPFTDSESPGTQYVQLNGIEKAGATDPANEGLGFYDWSMAAVTVNSSNTIGEASGGVPADNAFGGNDNYIRFTALDELRIKSIDAYFIQSLGSCAGADPQTITVELQDDARSVIETIDFNVNKAAGDAWYTLPVDFEVPSAGNYKLEVTGDCRYGVIDNTVGAGNYGIGNTYSIPGVMHFDSSLIKSGTPKIVDYARAFNWVIEDYSIAGTAPSCGRTPVTATLFCDGPCVNNPTFATLDASGAIEICSGGDTLVTVSSDAPAGYIYTWFRDGVAVTAPTPDDDSYNITTTGQYYVRISVPDTLTCYTESDAIDVEVTTITSPAFVDFATCSDTTLSAYVEGTGITYQWFLNGNPISGETDSLYTVRTPGTYRVDVFHPQCGSVSDDVIVSADVFTIDLGADDTICVPSNLTLDAGYSGTGVAYQWYDGNGVAISPNGASQTYEATYADTFIVHVTDPFCGTEIDSIIVSFDGLQVTPQTYCPSVSNDIDFTVDNPEAPDSRYIWYDSLSGGTRLGAGLPYTFSGASGPVVLYVDDSLATCGGGTFGYTTPPACGPHIEQPRDWVVAFDVFTEITLDSLSMQIQNYNAPGDMQSVTFRIHEGTPANIAQFNTGMTIDTSAALGVFTAPAVGANEMSFNLDLTMRHTGAPGDSTRYLLSVIFSSNWEMYVYDGCNNYPQGDGTNFTIPQHYENGFCCAGTNTSNWGPFYNMQISAGGGGSGGSGSGCCDRTAVPAYEYCPCVAPNATTLSPGGPITGCEPLSQLLTVNTPTAGYFYRWFNANDPGVVLDAGIDMTTYSATATGNYYVQIMDPDNISDPACDGFSDTVAITVTVPIAGVISVNPTSICSGDDVSLGLSGYFGTLQWQEADTATGAWVNVGTGVVPQVVTPDTVPKYFRVIATSGACTDTSDVVFVANAGTPFTVAEVQPTCVLATGSLVISGLLDNTNYDVSYTSGATVGPTTLMSNGSGVITISGLAAGTYTNITVSNGACDDIDSGPYVLTVPSDPVITLAVQEPTCAGGDGILYIVGVSGGFTYDVTYNSGGVVNTTQDPGANDTIEITGLSAGAITAISVDSLGCQSNVEVENLTNPTPPVITVAVQEPTCAGGDGILYIAGVSGGFTYDVTYNSGGVVNTTQDPGANDTIEITGLSAGAITAISVDSLGCQSNVEVESLTDPTPPAITTAILEPTCAGNDGVLYIVGVSGGFTYDVTYDNGGVVNTSQDPGANDTIEITGFGSGNVTSVSVDSLGCTSNVIPNETFTDPTIQAVGRSIIDPTCAGGDGVLKLFNLDNAFNYTVNFDTLTANGNVTTSATNDTITITGLPAGTIENITVDSLGCVANVADIALTDPTIQAVGRSIVDPTCAGGDGVLKLFNLDNAFSYTVNFDTLTTNGNVTTSATNDTITITGLPAGTIENITVDSLGCVANVADIALTDPTIQAVGRSIVDPTCAGGDGVLKLFNLDNAFSYTVNFDTLTTNGNVTTSATNDTITITGLPAGTIENITVDSLGCIANVADIALTDPTIQAVGRTVIDPTCAGGDGQLQLHVLDNAFNYVVNFDTLTANGNVTTSATNDTITITGLPAGTIENITVDSLGCVANVADIALTDPTIQAVGRSVVDPTCAGGDGQLQLHVLDNAFNYVVNFDTLTANGNVTTSATNDTITITGLPAGTIENITVDSLGCVANVADIALTDPTIQAVGRSIVDPTCAGGDGILKLFNLDNAFSYTVNFDTLTTNGNVTTSATNDTITITGLPAGTIENITVDSLGCIANVADIALTDPTIQAVGRSVVDPTCAEGDGVLKLFNLDNAFSYTVNFDTLTTNGNVTTSATNDTITITGLPAGTIENITVDSLGCIANVADIALTPPTDPSISVLPIDPSGCGLSDGEVHIFVLDNAFNYVVRFDTAGAGNFTSSATNDTIKITGLSAGGVNSITVDSLGCVSNVATTSLSDPSAPSISVTIDQPDCNLDNGVIYIAGLDDTHAYDLTYDSLGNAISTTLNPTNDTIVLTGLGAGTYQNITIDSNNCVDSDAGPFVLTNPAIQAVGRSIIEPTCAGGDGQLQLHVLDNAFNYVVNFDTLTANGNVTTSASNDTITITGLPAGTIENITVDSLGCIANVADIALTDPTIQAVGRSIVDPTCAGGDGVLKLFNLDNAFSYTVNFDTLTANGNVTTSATNDTITITGLPAGTIENITVDSLGCVANVADIALTDPTIQAVGRSIIDPTCAGGDGVLKLFNLDNAFSYTVNFDTLTTNGNVTTSATNDTITITGLPAGTIENITVDSLGCIANVADIALTDPTIQAVGRSVVDPTCAGGDGVLKLFNLDNVFNYVVNFDTLTANGNVTTSATNDTITITGLPAGTIENITVDSLGCIANVADIALTPPTDPSISVLPIDPSGCGLSDGEVHIFVLDNAFNYVVRFDTAGAGNFTSSATNDTIKITGLSAGGVNSITVDSLGCVSNVATTSLSDPSAPSISVTIDQPDCNLDNGVIYIAGLDDTHAYDLTYDSLGNAISTTLNPVNDTIVLTGLGAGTYQNIAIDSNNCVDSDAGPFVLTNPTIQAVGRSVVDPTCAGGDGILKLFNLDNAFNYTVNFDTLTTNGNVTTSATGDTIEITGLPAGTIENITVDSLGCVANVADIALTDPTIQAVGRSIIDPTCAGGDGILKLFNLDNAFNYTVNFDTLTTNGNVTTSATGDTITITGLPAGTIENITVDSLGCVANVADIALTDPTIQAVGRSIIDPTCAGGDGQLQLHVLDNAFNYVVNFDTLTANGNVTTSATNDTITITGLPAGTIENITVDSLGCVANVADIALTDPTIQAVGRSVVDPTCAGGDGVLKLFNLDNAFNYAVNFDTLTTNGNVTTSATGDTITITGLPAGTIENITVDSLGCIANVADIALTAPTNPTIGVLGVDPTACGASDGEVHVFTLDNAFNYVVRFDTAGAGNFTSSATNDTIKITGLSAGGINGITVDSLGCISNIATESLSDPSAPSISVTIQQPDCNLDNGIIYIAGLDDTHAYDLTYDSLGNAISTTLNPTNDTIVLTGLGAGTYQNITIDSNSCVDSDAGPFVLTNPTIQAVGRSIVDPTCAGGDGILKLFNLDNAFNYTVNFDTLTTNGNVTTSATGDTIEITGLPAGTIENITVDSLGCVANVADIALTDPTIQAVGRSVIDPTCVGGDGILKLFNLDNAFNYTVNFDTLTTNGNVTTSATGDTITITGLPAGTIENITVDSLGCVANVADIALTDPSIQAIGRSIIDPTCAGGDGVLKLFNLDNAFNYTVNFDTLTTNGNVTTSATGDTITITGLPAGTIENITVDSLGCIANVADIALTDPTIQAVGRSVVDPTCAGGDGVLKLFNLDNAFNYTVNFDTLTTNGNVTTSATGDTITITGLPAGTIENITVDSLGCIANVADITLTPPTNPTIGVLGVDPTACGASDGEVHIFVLDDAFQYDVSYNDGAAQTMNNVNPVNDTIKITGLAAGGINGITVDSLGCISNIETESLSDPSAPSISVTIQQPDCNLDNGIIYIAGLDDTHAYDLTYDSLGNAISTTLNPTNDTIVLTGLGAGTYQNITIDSNSCVDSDAGPFVLTNPAIQAVGRSIIDPTCAGGDGQLQLHVLDNAFNYVVNFDTLTANGNVTTSATNDTITITGLPAGTIENITVDSLGCIANVADIALTDPTIQAVGRSVIDPTCAGGDGILKLFNLDNAFNYTVNFDTLTTNGNVTTSATGDTITITGLPAGTITNITVDSLGCVANVADIDLTNPTIQAVGRSVIEPTCAGGDGQLQLHVLDNAFNYVVNFDTLTANGNVTTSATNDTITITGLPAGTIENITVDSLGCVATVADITLTDPTPPSITIQTVAPTCAGGDGEIHVIGLANGFTYNVSYDSPATTNTTGTPAADTLKLTGLAAGIYTNVIIDSLGCTDTDAGPFNLTNPGSPTISVAVSHPTACSAADGELYIFDLDNTHAYDVTYNDGAVQNLASQTPVNDTIKITGLTAGGITAISVDSAGCSSNVEVAQLDDPSAPSISVTIQQPDCNLDNGIIYIAGLDDTHAYDLTYDSLGNAISTTLNPTNDTIVLTGLGAGTYQNITIDSNNCVDSDAGPFVLTNPAIQAVGRSIIEPTCAGGDGVLKLFNLDNAFSYTVNFDTLTTNGNVTTSATNDTITITGLPAGTIENITVDSLGCIANVADIALTDPTIQAVGRSIIDPTCAGGDGQLQLHVLDNAFNYVVNFDTLTTNGNVTTSATNDTITITGLPAGTIENITVDSLGCIANVADIALTDPTIQAVGRSIIDPTCAGGDGQLQLHVLDNAFNYVVNFDTLATNGNVTTSATNDTITITGLPAGTIENITVDSLGCVANVADITLTDPTPPSITIQTVAPTCAGGDGEIHVIGLANGFTYNVSYDSPATTNTTGTPVNDTLKITGLSAATYTNITIDSLGCTDTDAGPFNLTNPGAPTITVGVSHPQSCGAADGELYILGLDNAHAYDVTYNDGAVQNLASQTPVNDTIKITGLSAGAITGIAVDSLGCPSNIEIAQLDDPTAPTITVTTLAPTCALNDGQIHITGLTNGFTYDISYDSPGTINTTGTPVNDTIKITGLAAGNYANITVDSLNCLDVEAGPFALIDPTNPQITTGVQEPTCGNDDGELYILGLDDGFAYDVTYNDGAVQNQTSTPINDTIAYTGFGPGAITAIQVDSLGCLSNSTTATFNTPLNPIQSVATPTPATICEGESSDVILTNFTGAIQWQESVDGINGWAIIPTETNDTLIVTLATAGSYFYRALVNINNGCEDTSNVAQVDVLTQPDAGVITLTDPLCVNDSLDIVATGASTAGLQWQISPDGINGWSDIAGETDDTIRVAYATAQTQYYRLIAGSGLCMDTSNTAQLDVIVCCIAPTVAEVTPLGPIDVCVGTDTLLTVTTTDAPAGYVYTWYEANDTTTPVSGPQADLDTFRTATPGDYFVRIQMPAVANCYLNSNEVTITNLPIAVGGTATAIPGSICDGQTAHIVLTGYTGTLTWQSSINSTVWDNLPSETNDTLTVNPDTTSSPMFYRAALVNSGICSDTSNIAVLTIETQANAGLAFASPTTICEGNSSTISLTAFSGGNIQWQDSTAAGWQDIAAPNGTSNSLTQTPSSGVSIYRAIIGGAGNCPDTSTTAAIITLDAAVGGTATSEPGTICEGEDADIILTGYVGTIQWQEFNGGAWGDIASATNDTMTVSPTEGIDNFRAIVTNSGQCTDTSNATTLTILEHVVAGNIIPENDTVCDGDVTILQVLNSIGTIQWQSSISNTTSWNNMAPGTNTSQAVQADAANALVYYRVTVTNGVCDDTTDFTSLSTFPVVTMRVEIDGPASVCVGDDATFTVTDSTGGGSSPSFQWTFNNAPMNTGNTMTLSPTSTNGTVEVSMTSDSACASAQAETAAQFLTVNPNEFADVFMSATSGNNLCAGDLFTFEVVAHENGGVAPTFEWFVNKESVGVFGELFESNTLNNDDSVTVVMTPSPEACLLNTQAIETIPVSVNVYAIPSVGELTPKTDSICYETIPTITMDEHVGDIVWQWSSDTINWNALITETGESITIDPLDYIGPNITTPTLIYLRAEVTNKTCSPAISDNVKLVKFPELMGTAEVEQDCGVLQVTVYQDDSENFFSNFTTWYYGTNGKDFTADGTLPEVIQQSDTGIVSGYYMAEFTNSINCPALYDTVYVEECPPPTVDIPNALTPNGDGDNETFWIRNIWYYPNNELRVYNRWGSLVYKEKGYNNDWDGTINGQPLPDATYWFILDLGNGQTIYDGDVTIFR